MKKVTAIAAASHFRRVDPSGNRTRTSATAVAATAVACPEGNEDPDVGTSCPGGLGRSNHIFTIVTVISDSAHVSTHVANARQRRRAMSHTATPIRIGNVT